MPSGRPDSRSRSAIRPAESGTSSDGFRISALPSAIAFGIVQFGTMFGKLNGVIDATTPTGCFSIRHSTPRLTSSTSPPVICGNEHESSRPHARVAGDEVRFTREDLLALEREASAWEGSREYDNNVYGVRAHTQQLRALAQKIATLLTYTG